MIIIERTYRYRVDNWEDARKELTLMGILLPDFAATNIEAGRPFTAPLRLAQPGHYITVRCEPDAHR